MKEQAAKVSEYEGTGGKGERRWEGKEVKVRRWISMNWEVQLLPALHAEQMEESPLSTHMLGRPPGSRRLKSHHLASEYSCYLFCGVTGIQDR
jgi:hypothetical protein